MRFTGKKRNRMCLCLSLLLACSFVLGKPMHSVYAGATVLRAVVFHSGEQDAKGPAEENAAESAASAEPEENVEENGNTLKMADGRTLTLLGTFRLTGYCSCDQCSEGYGSRTATGGHAAAGRTIAVDPRVIPYGTHVLINGHEYVAEDCGGAVKNRHIDIYFNSHREAANFLTNAEVYLIQ